VYSLGRRISWSRHPSFHLDDNRRNVEICEVIFYWDSLLPSPSEKPLETANAEKCSFAPKLPPSGIAIVLINKAVRNGCRFTNRSSSI
jgi:hypothetical protein